VAVARTGDWAKARALLEAAPAQLKRATAMALRQEAHALRSAIVKGITAQAPGGEPFAELSKLTLVARQLRGFGGSKALLVTAELRNSVSVLIQGDEAFVGINRSARSATGADLVNVAEVHEFGGPPVVIPITPKMRRFLFALFRKAGRDTKAEGSGAGVVVVQVPARPFLRPAFNRFQVSADRRFFARVAKELGWGVGG
jgi:phage gpG-like protein